MLCRHLWRIQPAETYPTSKCPQRHNSLVPTIAREGNRGVDLCFPSHSVSDRRVTLGHLIPLAYQMAQQWYVMARGLDCYLHAICQDETCWDRTKTQKKGPRCRDQHSNLYVICPQSASTSPPWQLLIISTLPPPPLRWFLWMYDANTDVKERAWLSMPCDTIVCWGWVTRYNGIRPCTALLWAA